MKGIMKRMKGMREGATLVTVVIATAFLVAIGVVILAASTRYLVSVYMERNTNENMYSAEGYLAELRTGLMQYAGDAALTTYKEIMEKYEKNKGKAGSEFGKRFAARIVAKLENTNSFSFTGYDETTKKYANVYYDGDSSNPTDGTIPASKRNIVLIDELRKLLKDGAPSSEDPVERAKEENKSPIASKKIFSDRLVADGGKAIDFPEGESGDVYSVIHFSPTKGYYVVLKNLVIDYKDDANYRTAIMTDIQINTPDYKFEGGKSLDEARDFIIISDGELDVEGGKNKFNGNIYTGAGMTDDTQTHHNSGININKKMYVDCAKNINDGDDNADVFRCEKLISRGNLEVYKGANVDIAGPSINTTTVDYTNPDATVPGDFYLKNIKLITKTPNEGDSNATDINNKNKSSSQHTEFKIYGNSYVENDLDIRDSNSIVELGGKYCGYSYNRNNVNGVVGAYDSTYSSAILVNGYNTTINAHNLIKLDLSGRAYVERDKNPDFPQNDIILGQSVAVKSDQLAYLLPDKYLKTKANPVAKSDADNDNTIDFNNPASMIDQNYATLKDDGTYDFTGLLNDFMGGDGANYLDASNPITANYAKADFAFLYLNFASDEKANEYFSKFFTSDSGNGAITKKSLMERSRPYLSTVNDEGDGGLKLDPALFVIAGNIIRNYTAAGTLDESNYYDGSYAPKTDLLNEGIGIGRRYMSLVTKLTAGDMSGVSSMRFADLPTEDQAPFVSNKLIDFAQFNPSDSSIIPISARNDETISVGDGVSSRLNVVNGPGQITSAGNYLYIANGNVNIATTEDVEGLIIANGDVTLNEAANFKGLIIASGNVKTADSGGAKIESNRSLVKKLFEYIQLDNDLRRILRGSSDPITNSGRNLENCIRYQDWTKNTY